LLFLAECNYFNKDVEGILAVLEKARIIDNENPMLYRIVAYGAILDKAFTIAHGAVFTARLLDIPSTINNDLEDLLSQNALMNQRGEYPDVENDDSRWNQFLAPMWHKNEDQMDFTWSEYQGYYWIIPKESQLISSNSDRALYQLGFSDQKTQSFRLIYMQAVLHLAGFFPKMVENENVFIDTNYGWMLSKLIHGQLYSLVEKVELIFFLEHFCKYTFNGCIDLSGPDKGLESALPTLLADFPFENIDNFIN